MSDESKLKTVRVRARDGGEEVIDGVESIEFPVSAPGHVTFTVPTGSSVRVKTIPRGDWLDGRHEVEVTGTAKAFAVVEDALWREGLPFQGEKPYVARHSGSAQNAVWDVAVWGPEHALAAAVRAAKNRWPALRIKVRQRDGA